MLLPAISKAVYLTRNGSICRYSHHNRIISMRCTY